MEFDAKQIKSMETAARNGAALSYLFECSRRAVKDKIVVISPGSFSGNSKYIYSYLHKALSEKGKIDCLYWLSHNKAEAEMLTSVGIRAHHCRPDAPTMKLLIESKIAFVSTHHIARSDYCMLQAAISGAVKVQMWHGLPAKRVAYEVSGKRKNAIDFAYFAYDCLSADYFVADSDYVANKRTAAFPAATPIICGTPRTDILQGDGGDFPFWQLGNTSDILDRMIDWRKSGRRVVMYAPTYRQREQKKETFLPHMKQFFDEFASNPDWLLVFKNHPIADYTEALQEHARTVCPERIIIAAGGDDIYPYLKETDVIVTDYSSVYYDFLLTDRKVVFFRPDYEEYTSYRVIHDEQVISGAPMGANTRTGKECAAAIIGQEDPAFSRNRAVLREKLFAMADGSASQRLIEEIRIRVPGSPLECLAPTIQAVKPSAFKVLKSKVGGVFTAQGQKPYLQAG